MTGERPTPKELDEMRKKGNYNKPKQVFIVPNGQAKRTDPCYVCGRLPEMWEQAFMIYSKPICEDCFWEQD